MNNGRTITETDFPLFGARARRWRRFENGLHAWLDTPEGNFAAWRARQACQGDPSLPALRPPERSDRRPGHDSPHTAR